MDFSQLDNTEVEGDNFRPDSPDLVAGRILHHDADFLAYQCGYKWEEESVKTSIEHLKVAIQTARIMAGAEGIFLYLTMGTKAGRYEAAMVQEYQAQRGERPQGLMDRVSELRHFMANCTDPGVTPKVQLTQEADDALTQAMHIAVAEGTEHLNPMWSMDKDLYMAPGIHMNAKTYELEQFPCGFGSCEIDTSTSSKKVVGKGTSFFWHQLLMGDLADNIPGLPFFSSEICMAIWPTKALLAAEKKAKAGKTQAQRKTGRMALYREQDKVKPKPVGPARAFEYLRGCKTDRECFRAVQKAYSECYGYGMFDTVTWQGEPLRRSSGDMMLEQARLLWMQRVEGEDVFDFFKEIMK